MHRIQEKLFPYSVCTSIPFVVEHECVWERRCYWRERGREGGSNCKIVQERL